MQDIAIYVPNIIGLCGITLILVMYLLLQVNKVQSTDIAYSVGNGLGSLFLLISLFFEWNLAAVVLQCAWLIISVYGILKGLQHNTAQSSI